MSYTTYLYFFWDGFGTAVAEVAAPSIDKTFTINRTLDATFEV